MVSKLSWYSFSRSLFILLNLISTTTTSSSQIKEQRAYLTAATAKQAARSPMKLPPPRIPVPVPALPPASAVIAGSASASTGVAAAPEGGLLNSADRKTVVEILGRCAFLPHPCIIFPSFTHPLILYSSFLRAGAISPEQAAALNILIEKGDDRIKRVFTVYEADKDVHKLIDELKIFNIQGQV